MMARADTGVYEAARVVTQGGVIAYPTESCYGLGCDPDNVSGIRRILEMKQRARNKGLIVIADRLARLLPWLDTLEESARQRAIASWPGPNTWLWPARPSVSPWLVGEHDTLAVRVTAHPVAARLCQQAGRALVSTSANRAARPALLSADRVRKEFGDLVDFVVEGRIGGDVQPSTIRHCLTGAVIRG